MKKKKKKSETQLTARVQILGPMSHIIVTHVSLVLAFYHKLFHRLQVRWIKFHSHHRLFVYYPAVYCPSAACGSCFSLSTCARFVLSKTSVLFKRLCVTDDEHVLAFIFWSTCHKASSFQTMTMTTTTTNKGKRKTPSFCYMLATT